jgi:hypothetical protein
MPRLALDVAVWYCLPVAFGLLYARSGPGNDVGALLHLLVVGLPLVAILLVRLLIARSVTSSARSRSISTLIVGAALLVMLLYYTLVLVGLSSWGAVITLAAIPACLRQAAEMAQVFGIPLYALFSGLSLICAGVFGVTWKYLKRFDWTADPVIRPSGRAWALASIVGLAGLVAVGTLMASGVGGNEREPLSLTLFPEASNVVHLEGHAIDRAKSGEQDRLEDLARRTELTALPRRKQMIEVNQKQVDFEGHLIDLKDAGVQDRNDAAARNDYSAAGAGERPNLILIVVDALRPDHMGIYGYGRDTTPGLNALSRSREVRVIRGVHASCGDTVCGLLSLMSSKFPRNFSLHPITLHEVLRRSGYRLHLILTGDYSYFYSLRSFYGQVDDYYDGNQAKGYFLNDDQQSVDRLAQMKPFDGQPAMFQFHLMSAHITRPPAKTPGPFQPAASYVVHRGEDTGPVSSPDPAATNFYDNGVAHTDAVIADLLATLESKGFLKKALVVVTADHGESLGEHGLFIHANSVREELLRVPLLLISYGYQPKPLQLRAISAQVDIAPTILTELGLPRPATWVGHPLQEPAAGRIASFEEHGLAGVLDDRDPVKIWKYWLDTRTGAEHVFELGGDPAENHDAAGEVSPALKSEWRALSGGGGTVASR